MGGILRTACTIALALPAAALATDAVPPVGGAAPHLRGRVLVFGNDYPELASVQEWHGVTVIEVWLDASGRPYACTVVHSAGRKDMDERACQIGNSRLRFTGARDEQGRPIPSTTRQWVPWFAGMKELEAPADIDMVVLIARLPGHDIPVTTIRRVEQADGTIESCAVEKQGPFPALDVLACPATANNRMGRTPPKDEAGHPIRALRTYRIAFTDKPIQPAAGSCKPATGCSR
jgi:TonB family protein